MQDRQCRPGRSALQVCPLAHCLRDCLFLSHANHSSPLLLWEATEGSGGIARVLPLYCTPPPFSPLPSPPTSTIAVNLHACRPLYWQVPDLYTTATQKTQRKPSGVHMHVYVACCSAWHMSCLSLSALMIALLHITQPEQHSCCTT